MRVRSTLMPVAREVLLLVALSCACKPHLPPEYRANTALTPATHTSFPIASGTHANIDCNTCHGEFLTFAQVDCLNGCHAEGSTDPIHAGMAGYSYTSAACLKCHPTGVGAPADHAKYFPIDSASVHTGIQCVDCHSDLANPTVATNFACDTCHLALDAALLSKHTTASSNPRILVNGNEISLSDSSTCLRCHADSQVDLTQAHPTTSPCGGSEGSPPHHNAGCTTCHDSYRSDKTFAADFALNPPAGCAHCHGGGTCGN